MRFNAMLRKFATRFALGLTLSGVISVTLCLAQTQAPAPAASEEIRVEKIELLDLQTDRIGFAVTPSIIPTQQVQVRMITFYGMRINGIPVFVPPVSEELDLHPGVRASLRRPMQFTIYFRDLSTLQPLIDLVKGGRIKIEGNALVEAKLDLLPSLLLRKKTAHAPLRIDADLPLDVPGGSLVREQTLKALSVAETGRSILSKSLLYLLGTDETQKRLQDRFGKSVLLAVARYEMTDSNHNRYPVEKMGVAFRATDRQIVTTGEMAEPWRFDSVIALKLKRGELTMVKDSYDLLLWPSGTTYTRLNGPPIEGNAMSLKKHDFRILPGTFETEKMVATENGARATLVNTAPRASASNLAILEFPADPKTGPPIVPVDGKPDPAGYPAIVAFRFSAGPYTQAVEPEIVRLSARVADGRLVFDDPIDSSALGSPVLSDNGLVGILQDETSAISYSAAAARLKLTASPK
jgi:hypothetical protein